MFQRKPLRVNTADSSEFPKTIASMALAGCLSRVVGVSITANPMIYILP